MNNTTGLVFLDFETYYASDYTLSKMTNQQYVLDNRFEAIGVAIAYGNDEPVWYTDTAMQDALDELRAKQDSVVVVAHNTTFDGAILAWHYNVHPMMLMDTLSMARTCGLQSTVGGSLSKLADRLVSLGLVDRPKGKEVVNALGKRRADFDPQQLWEYGEYCKHDVLLTRILAHELLALLPLGEIEWQSRVLQAYTRPQLHIDGEVVQAETVRVAERRATAQQTLAGAIGATDIGQLMSIINSNQKFAEMLRLFGVDAPTKPSTTNKSGVTYALSSNDTGLLELLEHPHPVVRELVTARLGLKSSMEEGRCRHMAWLATFSTVPVPYRISGARTHRLGGGEGGDAGTRQSHGDKLGVWNPQNLPSGRVAGQSKALRSSICTPHGHSLVGADSSQIEVRIIDYLAGDRDAMKAFADGVCPYSGLAVQLFGEGTPEQVKRDAKKGLEPWASRRQVSKSARLSLQFGSGAKGFRDYCLVRGINITPEEADLYKRRFRASKLHIVAFWEVCERVLGALVQGGQGHFGGLDGKLFWFDGARVVLGETIPGIQLPDGVWVSLPDIRSEEGKYGQTYVFTEMEGRKKNNMYVYGAKLAQLLTQATAFAVMKWYASGMSYPLVLNAHDEHVVLVPDRDVDAAVVEMKTLMHKSPPWLPEAQLECEVHVGKNYGDLK